MAREGIMARVGGAASPEPELKGTAGESGLIVTADWVVTAAHETPRRNWGIRVLGGLVDDAGPARALQARHPHDERCHNAGCVLLPGFVNAHVHLYGVLAHGVPGPPEPPADFWGFLNDYWWPLVEDALDHDMIAAAAAWVTAELAAGGTTSFFDILEAPNAVEDALFVQHRALADSGLRAVLSFEATERMGAANGQAGLQENVRFIKACRTSDHAGAGTPASAVGITAPAAGTAVGLTRESRVSGAMSIHTTFTCGEAFIRQAFEMATEHDVFCHAHVNEGVHEGRWCEQHHGMRTLDHYQSLGVASPRFQASQCVQLSAREMKIIADAGIRVSHMPLSNCEVGGGIAPIPELLASGVTVGLGSDGYLNDMYAVMRGAFLLHRAATLDPAAVSAATVLYLATEGSARTLGLSGVGRLDPGWHADLQVVDVEGPSGLPTPLQPHNLLDQLILWRSAHHVRRVMVGGDWIVAEGEVIGADVGQLRAHCHEQALRLWS